MNIDHFDTSKTGILFFDILNGYYHSGDSAAQARMKPWVDNAVRVMKAGRAANLPIFFAKGNHRPDNATTALLLTDTNNSLTPWPNGEVTKTKMHVIAGDKSSDVLADLEPQAGRLLHRQIPLERISSNLSRPRAAHPRHRHDHYLRRIHRCRRHLDFVFGQGPGL